MMNLLTFGSKCPLLCLALLIAACAPVEAFWRMPCRSRSGLARIDPLVSFGGLSEHAHAIHGGSAFSETATWKDLIASECTSCEVSQDKSAYWSPALYFEHSDGTFELVDQVGGMLAYYLLFPNSGNTTLSAFPEGFQMIAGDTNQRNFTYPVPDVEKSLWIGQYATEAFHRQAAVGFNCLNYQTTPPEPSLFRHTFPEKSFLDANCADGIRAELMFPSCWNGVDLDSTDHKSHVAYPSQVMTGDCPSGFPERLPSLFYETIWNTNAFNGQDGRFVFANGDPTGCGYHGDFIMGWERTFLQSAVDTCTNPSGKIEDCPLFTIQDSSVYGNCKIEEPAALASEKLISDLTSLPGNMAVVDGPEYAKGIVAGGPGSNSPSSAAAAIPIPAVSSAAPIVASVPSASDVADAPGAVFIAAASTSIEPPPPASTTSIVVPTPATVAPAPTVAPAAPADQVPLEEFFTTEYRTTGATVEEILWVENVVTVTIPYTSTSAIQGRKRHLHKHRAGH